MNLLVKKLFLILGAMCLSISLFSQQDNALYITVSGEVLSPGQYPCEAGVTTAEGAIRTAGGLTSDAFEAGIRVFRCLTDVEYERMALACRLAQENLEVLEVEIEVPDRSERYTVGYGEMLLSGDEVLVPKQSRSVKISGAVNSPASIVYYAGWTLDDYIRMAGGYAPGAAKGKIYILSPTGERMKKNAQLLPECEICVPTAGKSDIKEDYTEEIINICTSTDSVTEMVIEIVDMFNK